MLGVIVVDNAIIGSLEKEYLKVPKVTYFFQNVLHPILNMLCQLQYILHAW